MNEEVLRDLLTACVALIHRDPHQLLDSRPCPTCRNLRIEMAAAAVELGDATCWCVDKTLVERREEWKYAAHFPGCVHGDRA